MSLESSGHSYSSPVPFSERARRVKRGLRENAESFAGHRHRNVELVERRTTHQTGQESVGKVDGWKDRQSKCGLSIRPGRHVRCGKQRAFEMRIASCHDLRTKGDDRRGLARASASDTGCQDRKLSRLAGKRLRGALGHHQIPWGTTRYSDRI